jgi:hypothetical protein
MARAESGEQAHYAARQQDPSEEYCRRERGDYRYEDCEYAEGAQQYSFKQKQSPVATHGGADSRADVRDLNGRIRSHGTSS